MSNVNASKKELENSKTIYAVGTAGVGIGIFAIFGISTIAPAIITLTISGIVKVTAVGLATCVYSKLKINKIDKQLVKIKVNEE